MSSKELGKSGESNGDVKQAKDSKKNNRFRVLESTNKLKNENNTENKSADTHELRDASIAKPDSLTALMRRLENAHKPEHSQLGDQTTQIDAGDGKTEVKAIHSPDKVKTEERHFERGSRNFEDYQRKFLTSRL